MDSPIQHTQSRPKLENKGFLKVEVVPLILFQRLRGMYTICPCFRETHENNEDHFFN